MHHICWLQPHRLPDVVAALLRLLLIVVLELQQQGNDIWCGLQSVFIYWVTSNTYSFIQSMGRRLHAKMTQCMHPVCDSLVWLTWHLCLHCIVTNQLLHVA